MAPQKGGQANKQQQQQHCKQPSGATAVSAAAAGAAAGTAAAPAKKPAAAASRPTVVPAIPLPLLQRQSSKQHQNRQHHRRASSNVPTASPTAAGSSNGFPATSLEAALIDVQSGAGEPARALQRAAQVQAHAQKNLRTSGNGVPASAADAAATATGANKTANGTRNADEKVNGSLNGNTANMTNGNHKHQHDRRKNLQPANGINGTNGSHGPGPGSGPGSGPTNGVSNITFGDVAPDPSLPAAERTAPLSADTSTAPSVLGDGDSLNSGLSAHHHPGPEFSENDQLSSSSAPTSQPQSATHLPVDFMHSSHAPANGYHAVFNHQQDHLVHSNTGNRNGLGHPNGMPAPPHMHNNPQHHVNGNGNGIVFGGMGFPDSHSSSPAPMSAGFMPPPGPFPRPPMNGVNGDNGHGFHPVNGHPAHMRAVSHGHGHAHTDSNGTNFPMPLTPYRPEMNAMSSAMDGHGPVPAPAPGPHGPFDGHPPPMGHFGPHGPHGFPDSAAPGEPNGARRPMPPANFAAGVDLHHAADDEWMQSSARYMRDLFDSAELSDCVLELVFPTGQSQPLTFNAHKLILARSPALKNSVIAIGSQDSKAISIETDDTYVQPEAWRWAIQHLYQGPLPNFYTLSRLPGGPVDHFFWCLSYAAAGHLLQLHDIFVRGLDLAVGLIDWNTIEEGLAFALDGATHGNQVDPDTGALGPPYLEYFYGQETRHLVFAMMNFLVNRFPANFVLDRSVVDPPRYARIPVVTAPPKTTPAPAPAIARGSSGVKAGQEHEAGMASRLVSLQFGDIPPVFPEDDNATRKPAQCSPDLSRVLLNLPFQMLQVVLTSESNGISGWNTAQDRYHAVTEVIAEREARRLRAVDALRSSTRPGVDEIQKQLSRKSASPRASPWDVLNWQEEVMLPSGAGVPVLGRKWVPQFSAGPRNALMQQPIV